jgi:RHS repeat-associated protein
VTVTATDTQSGLKSLTFPDVFAPGDGDERSLTGQHGPEVFQHTYPFLGSQVVSDTFVVSATDQVDIPGQAQPFRVAQDAISPTAAITVPAAAGLSFQVVWAGQDGESGVRGYEVQYRDALTPTWTAWLSGTAETQAPFFGQREHSYTFQVRATDNVSNTGAWTESLSVTVSAVTKYYYHGGTRVAMRQGDVVYFLHTDHLGSTSLTTDEDGLPMAQARYLPYGEERWTAGGAVSDYTFTGQRAERSFGLMDYNARYYDPYLGRFISADSIVPNPLNPQLFNRYSYSGNNPVRFNDPDGHCGPLCPAIPLAASAGPPGWAVAAGLFAIGTVIAFQVAEDLDVSPPPLRLDSPSEGLQETIPLEAPADPYYIPGPTLDSPEWQPVFPGPPLDSGADAGSRSLDFPLNQQVPKDHVFATSGTYEFPDQLNPGQTYVGQSSNIERRLNEHERTGRYSPTAGSATTTSVPGNKMDREIAEQNRINQLGGIQGGKVSNQRNPIGPGRREEAILRGLIP